MSETSQSHSPEAPTPIPHIEGAPEGLQLTVLDQVVGLRAALEAEYNNEQNPSLSRDEYVQRGIEARLRDNGIEPGDTDASREQYDMARDMYEQAAAYDKVSWRALRHKLDTSPREEAFQIISEWNQKQQAEAERQAIREGIDQVRDRYAKLLVERTQKVFELHRGRIKGEEGVDKIDQLKNIDQAREEFGDYISAMATEMALEYAAQGQKPAEYADKIDEFIAEQTDMFISTFEDMRADVYKERKGIVKWALDKWASWSTDSEVSQTFWQRITSKENLKSNLKKGAVFALPSFAIGAAAGAFAAPLIAAVGAGAAVAGGVGALIARGLARNAATHKLDSVAHSVTIAERQAQDFRLRRKTSDDLYEIVQKNDGVDLDTLKDDFDTEEEFNEFKAAVEQARSEFDGKAAHEVILGLIDERTDFYRKQNRNRFLAGTAISVASGALGGVVGGLISHQIGNALHISNGAHMPTSSSKPSSSVQPSASAAPSSTGASPSSTSSPSPSPSTSPGATPNPTDNPNPDIHNPGDGSKDPHHTPELPTFKVLEADERTISRGEGWYQTFREMGVSAKHRAELLNEIGPYLKEKGLAYWDNKADEWRMNMTDSGKLPTSAIRHIAETAHEHGWHSDYDKFFETTSTHDNAVDTAHETIAEYAQGRDESVIAPGESGEEFMRELGIHDAKDRHAVWNDIAPRLHDDKLTYYDKANGDWRLNMTSDGKMPVSAIETAVEAAQHEGIETDYTSILASANHLTADNSFTANQLVAGNQDMKAYDVALKNVNPRHKADLLSAAAHELRSFGLTEKVDGVWRFREVGSLPPKAADILSRLATKNHWTLAA